MLVRALKGGWRFAVDTKTEDFKSGEPEKNEWSHPGDAFGYGCRYFHKSVLGEEKRQFRAFTPPTYRANEYHVR